MACDGKLAQLSDLTPGMTLSHVQARTVTQSEVTTVTTGGLDTHSTRAALVRQTPAQVGALLIFRSK